MHGEVLMDENNCVLEQVRLWCNARNAAEGDELTNIFQVKVPKRATRAQFLWTIRHHQNLAEQTQHVTTPAGWMARVLKGQYNLGSGDAAGMFPVNPQTRDYDTKLLDLYYGLVQAKNPNVLPLQQLLPSIRPAGQDAFFFTELGASLLGIPYDDMHNLKIPVAAGEGDQVAALAGSLIGNAGTISYRFG
jgi:sugar (pentulose or hexulose) kinase